MNSGSEDRGETRPGPDPERVKIEKRDWREAVKEALERKKPKEGWPDQQDDTEDSDG